MERTGLCGCGSGLSEVRCCALEVAQLGLRGASRHLQPVEEAALRAHSEGRAEEAERLLLDVLELAPVRIPALAALYEIRKGQKNAKAALALITRIVGLDPNNFWATNEVALALLSRGDAIKALQHARSAVRIGPQNAQSHYLMGMALTEANRPAIGEYHYQCALELSGTREPVVLSNMALCLKNQGKMEQARALYAEALEKAPDNLHTLLGFARLEEADRKLDSAAALLDRAEVQWPRNPNVQVLRAMVLRRKGDAPAALSSLEQVDNSNAGAVELMEKGRLLDRMDRFDEAFAAFDAGKQRLREVTGQRYLDKPAGQLSRRLKRFFVAKRLENLPRAGHRSDIAQPIFILGFPRSGTTLLEQSLSAHPRISGGDELPLINEIAELLPRMLESPLPYPDALAELWMGDHREDLDGFRDFYLRKASQLGIPGQGAAWFTDKMPLNETHLGLIHLLFPQSQLLHVSRHPLDVVISAYSNLLTHGFYCAYALETIARHYVLVSDLVEHYRTEIRLRYLRVRYEDLVDGQEKTLREVLAFVGEDFDPACLAFHENQRYARTASYAQVTEKLYDRSRYRYRNYLSQLRPVIPILQPVIERLGYTVL